MAVYPFYIETQAEGRNTPIAGGTRRKDGSMTTTIYQRENGAITTQFEVRQFTETRKDVTGEVDVLVCVTRVYYEGQLLKEHVTQY